MKNNSYVLILYYDRNCKVRKEKKIMVQNKDIANNVLKKELSRDKKAVTGIILTLHEYGFNEYYRNQLSGCFDEILNENLKEVE